MRLVNQRMEIMLEMGGVWVKPVAEMDKDGWKASLDYRIGQYKRFLRKFFDRFSQKLFKKVKIAYKFDF